MNASSSAFASSSKLQRGRRLETTESLPAGHRAVRRRRGASTGPSSGDDGEDLLDEWESALALPLQRGRRLETTERAEAHLPQRRDAGASTGPSSGDDGEGRLTTALAGEWVTALQRGRRLETTESTALTRAREGVVLVGLQRGRRLETTERSMSGFRRRASRQASTGPSSGDDGEFALFESTKAPRGRFNGAVVWRRRRAGHWLDTCSGLHASTGPSSGDDGEITKGGAPSHPLYLKLQRGRRLETTERPSESASSNGERRCFNGAVVWRRRREQLTVFQRLRSCRASTGPSSGDDGETGRPVDCPG